MTSALETPRRGTDARDAARRLRGEVRGAAAEAERRGSLPASLVASMRRAGIFGMAVPRQFGGGELPLAEIIEVVETLSEADASPGWCVAQSTCAAAFSGYLPADFVAEMCRGEDGPVAGGVLAPKGTAQSDDGRLRVEGRWPSASNCEHCSYIGVSTLVFDDGQLRRLPSGMPDPWVCVVPRASVEIVPNWSVMGLRGTGSHDLVVAGASVPADHAFSLFAPTRHQDGALYRVPLFAMFSTLIAAVTIGIARASIAAFMDLALVKAPLGQSLLAEQATPRTQVAQAEAAVRSARAFLMDAVGELWTAIERTGEAPAREGALVSLASIDATARCAHAVDLMYHAGGASSIRDDHALQKHFRDVHVAMQHGLVTGGYTAEIGRILFATRAGA